MNLAQLVLPPQTRQWMRRTYNAVRLDRGMRQFIAEPATALYRVSVLDDLIEGWGNTGYAAKQEYLRLCIDHALKTDGAILECGTGLSTLLLAVVAKRRNLEYWALEHSPEWSRRVHEYLVRYNLHVSVCTGGLRDYGDYSWYEPPLADMPPRFSLVVCDGPPGVTNGGRYGLVPIMRHRLAPGCVILIDDAGREQERAIARQWQRELNAEYMMFDGQSPAIRLTLP